MTNAKPSVKGAVVFTARSDIQSVLRQTLKERQVEPIITAESVERCIEDLISYPRALLCLDWGIGAAKALQVLDAVNSPLRIEIRPIFLFSQNEDAGLGGICIEYGVLQVHEGPITSNIISDKVGFILKHESIPDEVRDGLELAAESRRHEDWDNAGNILNSLNERYPKMDRIVVDLAENYFHQGDFTKAKELLKPLTTSEPPDTRALNTYGRIQMKEGDFAAASVTLQKAKFLNPFNVERLIDLGNSYLQINMIDRAEDNFRDAVEKHGSDDQRAIGGLGKSLLLGDKIEEGLVFVKQLSGDREMASVFNSAAIINMQNHKHADGMHLYQIALDTVGRSPVVLSKIAFNVGVGFMRCNDQKSALEAFALAISWDSENSKAFNNFQALARKLGKPSVPSGMEQQLAALKGLWDRSTAAQNAAGKGAAAGAEPQSSGNDQDPLDEPDEVG